MRNVLNQGEYVVLDFFAVLLFARASVADIATPSSAYSDPGICTVWLVNAANMASTMVFWIPCPMASSEDVDSGFAESADFGGSAILGE
ncbi:hypothetical protein FRC0411_00444 [Corynebacterium diphtheriae]|nr:hypothetical protein CIP107506_00257 [Corynebacterium diphtheriae]CAB0534743.1 hypothetical protein CIP107508_00219 [Corynebacterium diphtheriae]CAB0581428.1 hypothetical protein CIP107541_00251 [Corynebacterium diphtheriae]CAB0629825.1 hypothetical protein CIP107570_00268 [Corynebacterium diphtheriae]CAB0676753.1 hypothetical protein FRC0084_00251 [Corynebacterium diphtheriae]